MKIFMVIIALLSFVAAITGFLGLYTPSYKILVLIAFLAYSMSILNIVNNGKWH